MKTQWWLVSAEWWVTANALCRAVTHHPILTTHYRSIP